MKIRRYYQYFREYGFRCSLAFILSLLFPYHDKGKLSWSLLQHKHNVLLKYLKKHYYHLALNSEVRSQKESKYKDCIWTAWLQGEENAPESIRMTLASIRQNANGHQVIVLTNRCIDQFVEVPKKIKEKYKLGIIGNAHYADVVRMMVLAKYGGLWLDATTLLHEQVNEESFSNDFYSVAQPDSKPSRDVANHRWIVGIIGGMPESVYLARISSMLNAFWCEHIICIDYLVFDYLLAMLYHNDKSFSATVEALARMEYSSTALRRILNTPYDENTVSQLMIERQIYTITYKQYYFKSTPDGRETVYGHLYKSYLGEKEG